MNTVVSDAELAPRLATLASLRAVAALGVSSRSAINDVDTDEVGTDEAAHDVGTDEVVDAKEEDAK